LEAECGPAGEVRGLLRPCDTNRGTGLQMTPTWSKMEDVMATPGSSPPSSRIRQKRNSVLEPRWAEGSGRSGSESWNPESLCWIGTTWNGRLRSGEAALPGSLVESYLHRCRGSDRGLSWKHERGTPGS